MEARRQQLRPETKERGTPLVSPPIVGQVGNLRPIGNRPVYKSGQIIYGPITNPPQIANLPHKFANYHILPFRTMKYSRSPESSGRSVCNRQ